MNLEHLDPLAELTVQQAISMPGGGELLLILLIVLVVFGHNRIPQLGDALGKGIKNFRKSFAKDETEIAAAEREVRRIREDDGPDVQDAIQQKDTVQKTDAVQKKDEHPIG